MFGARRQRHKMSLEKRREISTPRSLIVVYLWLFPAAIHICQVAYMCKCYRNALVTSLRVACGWWCEVHPHTPLQVVCYASTQTCCVPTLLWQHSQKQKDFLHRNSLRLRDAHLYILASGIHTPFQSRHTGASRTEYEETRSTPYNLDLNPQTHTMAKKSKSSCVHSVHAQTKTPHVVAFWVKHLLYWQSIP